jgi:hypothetical protein
LPTIKRTIRPRRMKWAGYVTRMAYKINLYRTFKENFKAKDSLEDLELT